MSQTSADAAARDETAVSRFVERFASTLAQAGFPPMAARVFVALLAADSGSLTSAELSEQLRISSAAVSGAVRFLIQVNVVLREREPGSRRDVYRVYEHVWQEVLTRRMQILDFWNESLRAGIDAVGAATPAGRRLSETLDFFVFLDQEVPDMIARWRERQSRGAAS
ncbi:MarR family transcriptional regulator [Dactylosporangium sp. NPDC051485]|uniref:GbsR/MarR family transcriptional regulator n=1 Tax=Dactylosporangium sp. NPDC051485 TaxID=3154846 RepID=UPI00341D85C5